ncbi:ImmA/IrrE family metallo-endopeptidase [Blautia obeum]|uniref:ImmA/IrrE family metallo-endopeptidase n=1 Tax=Blautia obeum TaxID=40520 RepID=UPI001DE5339C|nr:ImmA/IrrE family metallo-endopeptidase [Blautia obeum]
MPTVNVNIQPAIISWALSQTSEEKLGTKLVDNIKHWLDGTKSPTFNQIEDFSKKSHIPLGYFFLQTPPIEQISLLEYRTLDSIQLTNPSRNLIDTIHDMEAVQEWMVNYRKEWNYDTISIVGSLKGITDISVIADTIRKDLGLNIEWYKDCGNPSEAFNKVRGLLEECGIVVMMNGIVGKNTHRALDVKEFRAFAMVNEWAPLIFINGADSAGGRLFSLFHELVHLWIGENDLYNDTKYSANGIKPIEVTCNAVAGALMVPKTVFLEKWNNNTNDDIHEKIKELARMFRCSSSVIARRALDNKKIDQNVYNMVIADAIEAYIQTKQEKSSGGDYYRVARSKLDGVFVRALCESVNSGRTSFTEAYRLTNTTSKTFSEVASGLGGVLW